MKYEMRMPDLATTGADVRIIRWHAQPGEGVRRGMPLLEIETDKATMDVECVVDGTLAQAVAGVNEMVPAGKVIAILDVADVAPVSKPEANQPRGGMFARNRAARSAPAATPAGKAKTETDRRPMSIAHRTAMKRLVESKQQVPHFYLQSSVNAAGMIRRRKEAEPQKIAWDAFFACALYRAIQKFDAMAYRVDGDSLIRQPTEAIGIAVDHEGDLYVVPVEPAGKSPAEVSAALRNTVDRLRKNDGQAKRLHPCLMTVTNLGAQGVEAFTPIINPPESAILGIGKVMPTPVARVEGRIAIEQRVSITLSVDHRVVSGKYAADFLAAVVQELETI